MPTSRLAARVALARLWWSGRSSMVGPLLWRAMLTGRTTDIDWLDDEREREPEE